MADGGQIALVRHAEKPPLLGPPHGVDAEGERHPHSLTVRGWQRAGALAPFFCDPRTPLLQRPQTVFAPPAHGSDGDHGRPFETVCPVAERLGVAVDTTYALDAEAALVAAVRAAGGNVLIAWEHNRIPRIANALSGDSGVPQRWPDERFDVVWLFDWDAAARRYRFSQLPQLLLAGDLPTPIPV